jgi:hypothetical protein
MLALPKKLSLAKQTLRNLALRTGIKAGDRSGLIGGRYALCQSDSVLCPTNETCGDTCAVCNA